MDLNKYSVPSLPTMQHILEDLSDPNIVQLTQPTTLTNEDEILQKAYVCCRNFQQLQEDSLKMNELNDKLEELNRKLIENIGSMKTHS